MRYWFLLFLFAANTLADTIYVSTQGNDAWSGRYSAPLKKKTDGPLLTIEKALKVLSQLKQTDSSRTKQYVICLRGGKYFLPQTIKIDSALSGEEQFPLVFTSFRKESAVLSGGVKIPDFHKIADPNIHSRFDDAVREKMFVADLADFEKYFYSVDVQAKRFNLIYDDKAMTLSRYPESGFITFTDTPHVKGASFALRFTPDERLSRWKDENDLRAFGYWRNDWYSSYLKPTAIVSTNDIAAFAGERPKYGLNPGQHFYFVNILAEVNAPGEYYLDRIDKKLYFYPPGEMTKPAEIPALPAVFSLDHASNVTFSNLTIQTALEYGAQIRGSSKVAFDRCVIRNCGLAGIALDSCEKIAINDCDLSGFDASSVTIENCGSRQRLKSSEIKIANNSIRDFERSFTDNNFAVKIRNSVGVFVSQNSIYDSPGAAIFINGNDNIIDRNEFHHLNTEEQDIGSIYMWGDITSQGNVIRLNYFHDIQSIFRPEYISTNKRSQAVHLDGLTSGVKVESNVFKNCGRGVLIEGGSDISIRNNIFYQCDYGVYYSALDLATHPDNRASIYWYSRGIPYRVSSVWLQKYPRLLTLMDDPLYTPKYNLCAKNIFSKTPVPISINTGKYDHMPYKDNYISLTSAPFNEKKNDFVITKKKAEIKKIGFEEFIFNAGRKK